MVGAGASGNTTAKLSLLQSTHLSKIFARHGRNTAKAYVEGNHEGMEWVLHHCDTNRIDVQREDAYTYAQSARGVPSARAEWLACSAAGLPVTWEDRAGVPFSFHGGVRLPDQAQFDPVPFLDSLVTELLDRGGRLVEGARVRKVAGSGDGLRLYVNTGAGEQTDDGTEADAEVFARQLVLATGILILIAVAFSPG